MATFPRSKVWSIKEYIHRHLGKPELRPIVQFVIRTSSHSDTKRMEEEFYTPTVLGIFRNMNFLLTKQGGTRTHLSGLLEYLREFVILSVKT